MTDRKTLIGDIADGIVLHQQADWTPGSDRLADPEGRVLALLSEIDSSGGGGSGGGASGGVNTIYVDAERTDEYTPDGTFDRPFILVQDGIDALMAMSPDGSELHGALTVAPSRKYRAQADQLIMTLPSSGTVTRNLTLMADSIGASNTIVLPPLRIDSPSNASINYIAIRGLCFASTPSGLADKVLHVKGHPDFTGQLRLYISDVQFNTTHTGETAFYVDDGGGTFGMYAVGHTLFTVKADDNGNAIQMERGWMILRGSNVWGGAAPAINLSGSASVTLVGGELTVTGGENTDLATLADASSINLRDVFATPRGNGDVVSHTGAGGFIGLYDVVVDQAGTGDINAPNGAAVLLGVCTYANGAPVPVNVASPAQIVRLVPGAQVAYADSSSDGGDGSAWNANAPLTVNQAIDRLATQVAAHLGGAIPE